MIKMKFTHTRIYNWQELNEPRAKVAYHKINNPAVIDAATIHKWIEEGTEYLRNNPDANSTFFETGDTLVHIYREEEESMKHFVFTVAKRVDRGTITIEDE